MDSRCLVREKEVTSGIKRWRFFWGGGGEGVVLGGYREIQAKKTKGRR